MNPMTERAAGSAPDGDAADVDVAVQAASRAFPEWSSKSAAERGRFLKRFAAELEARAEEFALLLTSENGSPVFETLGQAKKSPGMYRFFADMAADIDVRMTSEVQVEAQFGSAEQEALREAVRGSLQRDWSYSDFADPAQVTKIYELLAELGVTDFCSQASEGGLAAAISVLSELGRATCPAPVLEAVVANIAVGRTVGPVPSSWVPVLEGVRSGQLKLAFSLAVGRANRRKVSFG